jgi:hypothetical protein
MATSGTAWADGGHTREDAATHRYLDSNADGDVYTLPRNSGDYQLRDEHDWSGNGLNQLRNWATSRCLYVRAGHGIYAYTKLCNKSTPESYMWEASQPGDIGGQYAGSRQLKSEETGNVLDSNADGRVLYALPPSRPTRTIAGCDRG